MARWALVTALALGAVSPLRAAVVGKIDQVGFPGRLNTSLGPDGGFLVRHGMWAPIRVSLRVEGGKHFTGFLRATQKDNDGDVVASQVPVTLTAGAERDRSVWLYFLPRVNARQELAVSVRLIEVTEDGVERAVPIITPEGAAVDRLKPARELLPVDDEHGVILDISARRVDAIHRLTRADENGETAFRRSFDTARADAGALPDAGYGLEMIDDIIWDDADPSVFDGLPRQLTAIIEWVHQGGCLVVASEQRWPALARCPLGPYLPVDPGEITQGREYPGLRALSGRPGTAARSEQTVSYCRIKPRAGAHAMPAGQGGDSIVYERQVGHGRIIAVGAALQRLLQPAGLPAGIEPEAVLARLLRLRKKIRTEDERSNLMRPQPRHLFPAVRRFIDFQAAAGLRLGLAILFVIAYILLATFGSWEWLRRRGWLRHSWTTFAVAAVAASAVSIIGVGWVQGIRTRIQQFTIIDGEANTSKARAHVLFGLKTPTHTNLDVWLPRNWLNDARPTEEACWLRPIPGAADGLDTGYAAPGRYAIQPARATLYGVPIRATLKQLAGYWTGSLPGQIRASIRTARSGPAKLKDGRVESGTAMEITSDSWLLNDLKVDLVDSFLLHSMNVWPGEEQDPDPRRDQDIYIRRLGPIAAGERIDDLHARLYNITDGKPETADEPIPPYQRAGGIKVTLQPYSLMRAHKTWAATAIGSGVVSVLAGGEFSGLADWDQGVLLLTTLDEYIGAYPGARPGSETYTAPMLGGHGRSLDRSALLTPGTVLFIGFAETPGPARLKVRSAGAGDDAWRVLHPRRSRAARRTVYRVTIPVKR